VVEIEPLTPVVGGVVHGVDLGRALDDVTVKELRGALLDHGVLFFLQQDMTDDDQLRLAEAFGPVMTPLLDSSGNRTPGVTVADQAKGGGVGTDRWHCDTTFVAEPPLGAILRAVQLPAVGGDTLFASMYAAYDALSPAMREMLDGLTARHSPAFVNELLQGMPNIVHREGQDDSAIHPVIRVHPETGRKLLFVNSNWTVRIVELALAESRALLDFLYEHVKSPEFQCRFRWEPGSVAFWDNRAVQHFAVPDYIERRVMHRVLIAGDAPRGPARS